MILITGSLLAFGGTQGNYGNTQFTEANHELFEVNRKSTTLAIRTNSYTNTGPIVIDGNSNFTTTAALNGWNGTGSQADPIIIEYLNFENDYTKRGINIQRTDLYFVIQHSLFNGAKEGIWLERVKNGLIHNNTIDNTKNEAIMITVEGTVDIVNDNINITGNTILDAFIGIKMDNTDRVKISDNLIEGNTFLAIHSLQGQKTITNNIIKWNGFGGIIIADGSNSIVSNNYLRGNGLSSLSASTIFVGGTGINNRIDNNIVTSNTGIGITIDSVSQSLVTDNYISSNSKEGLHLYSSDNNTISGNKFSYNDHGIYIVTQSTENKIFDNIIFGSRGYGLYLGDSVSYTKFHNNTVTISTNEAVYIDETFAGVRVGNELFWNNFIENFEFFGVNTQSFDFHGDNNFTQNYWEGKWMGSDVNGDGFMDSPYFIAEDLANTSNDDSKPLSDFINTHHHFFSDGTLQTPISSTISGITRVTFSQIFDSRLHTTSYNVYYTINGGTTWIQIVSNSGSSFFDWDTYGLAEGVDIQLKTELVDQFGDRFEIIYPNILNIDNPAHEVSPAQITSPLDLFKATGNMLITWDGHSSSWLKPITFNLTYSDDDGTTWNSIESDLTTTTYNWNTSEVINGDILLRVETISSGTKSFGNIINITIDNSIPTISSSNTESSSTFSASSESSPFNTNTSSLEDGTVDSDGEAGLDFPILFAMIGVFSTVFTIKRRLH